MDDIKIKVIDSDKLINAINEGSYDVDLSTVMALGGVISDTKKQEICEYCHLELRAKGWHSETKINYCPMCGRRLRNG